MTTEVMTKQDTAYVDRFMIESAWDEQVQAVDRWEWLAEHNQPADVIETAWDEVEERTADAMRLEELYREQFEQEVC